MKRLLFTVTNDLTYDQRMQRICTSLAQAGYQVTLVGVRHKKSLPLSSQYPFSQKRIPLLFHKGFAFYAEYNMRLFFWLLFKKADLFCAIDLDTILPIKWVSRIRRKKRVYDAHELFCEMKEVVSRPRIYKWWKRIERSSVPAFPHGYTVNQPIADIFNKAYGVKYEVIANMPWLRPLTIPEKKEKIILYQGAVNEGRSFETLLPAMQWVNARLHIAGDGNFMQQARQIVKELQLQDKVSFLGKIEPIHLPALTRSAWIGITLFENKGTSNYLSLANRFFDYLHAGVPQLCVGYPVYKELNQNAPVAVLITDLSPQNIAEQLNLLLENTVLYKELQQNCLIRREELSWNHQEQKLLSFYNQVLNR